MSRYIDADKAKELWSGEHPTQIAMRRIFDELPTADVAPRAEAEKWFREFEELQGRMIELEREVTREIFEEIEKHILENCCVTDDDVDGTWKHIAELKNKYTEKKRWTEIDI